MKRGFLTALATILFLQFGNAQTIKTGVLIIGDGCNAVGASIQSSVSGAKTVLLLPGHDFDATLPSGNLYSGIEAELIKRLKVSDQSKEVQAQVFGDKAKVGAAIRSWTDTLKNLTIIKNARDRKSVV